jgi:predicted NAD/FAD-binding protein
MDHDGNTCTVYWMNALQGVSQKKDYFLSINDPGSVDPQKVLWKGMYSHPVYSVASQQAQAGLLELNGQSSRVFFAGAYFRYGFHEDGLWSGLQAARALSGERIWD